jgi:ribosomal protein S18 acetylase RimI-like enzyme
MDEVPVKVYYVRSLAMVPAVRVPPGYVMVRLQSVHSPPIDSTAVIAISFSQLRLQLQSLLSMCFGDIPTTMVRAAADMLAQYCEHFPNAFVAFSPNEAHEADAGRPQPHAYISEAAICACGFAWSDTLQTRLAASRETTFPEFVADDSDLSLGRLHWIAVHPAHGGKGLARAVVREAMRRLVSGSAFMHTATHRAHPSDLAAADSCPGFSVTDDRRLTLGARAVYLSTESDRTAARHLYETEGFTIWPGVYRPAEGDVLRILAPELASSYANLSSLLLPAK